jgi:hypothetical protein
MRVLLSFQARVIVSVRVACLQDGAARFRRGLSLRVVDFAGLTPIEEDEVLRGRTHRISGAFVRHKEETARIEVSAEKDDQIPPGGPIYLKLVSPEWLLIIADALAKSVALARDEREVAGVFELFEPFARRARGKGPVARWSARRAEAYRQCAPRAAPRRRDREAGRALGRARS